MAEPPMLRFSLVRLRALAQRSPTAGPTERECGPTGATARSDIDGWR